LQDRAGNLKLLVAEPAVKKVIVVTRRNVAELAK